MTINDWNDQQVKRAENTWGHKTPAYTIDMFEAAIAGYSSWLDLGCGFGRFFEYLSNRRDDPNYYGYDSSQPMIDRIRERFPTYYARFFPHNITDPINVRAEVIIASAVLIHITLKEQHKVLTNISNAPLPAQAIILDINSPNEKYLERSDHFERIISPGFRMTWQSHYVMTKKLLSMFPTYDLTMKTYPLHANRHKVIYILERRGK